MNIEIANRMVELRKQNGLSQEELASRLGISRQAVSKWERAEASPDTDNLINLARLYGVSLDELLKTDEPIEVQNKETEPNEAKNEEKTNPWLAFPYPVLMAIIYLLLGFFRGLWHPGWIIFLTIPFYYSTVNALSKK